MSTPTKPSTKLFVGAYVPAAEPFPILIACARDAEGRESFCGLAARRGELLYEILKKGDIQWLFHQNPSAL